MMKDLSLKILYLEDNPDDAELVNYILKKSGININMQRVDSRQDFVEAIRQNRFDVILSDHSLPQFNSTDALRICNLAHVGVPFILVTGTVSEEFAVHSLKQGADDYVLKSNLARLPTAILNSIKQRQMASDRLNTELTLRDQNEELLKINRELDSIVYSVSHNLRSPLLSVLGLLNLAKTEEHPRHLVFDSYLKMMETSVRRLDDTLKEILDYSRNARLEVSAKPIAFEKMIENSMSDLKYIQGFDQIHFHVETEGNEVLFLSDPYRLSMVICNLLSNAIKYRDEDKPQSTISVTLTIREQSATISFIDNGIGIPNEITRDIFNMFYRGTEKSNGAGLGLYIVKETLDKLKGSIKVSSIMGEGSTFTVTVPNRKYREETVLINQS